MGRIAIVVSTERVVDESGAHALEVIADPNDGDLVTATHFSGSGDDAPPLRGDTVALEDSTGAGAEQISGYVDTRNASKAAEGEKRIYARDPNGNVVAEIHLKGSGSITVENGAGSIEIAASGTVTINGVEIDPQGNITTTGDISAGTIAASVDLIAAGLGFKTHVHPTAAPGAPSPPQGPPPPP